MSNELSNNDYKSILELKDLLRKKFGALIEEVYCYGSKVYARKEDTDFDILIVTVKKIDWKEESKIFSEIYEFGVFRDLQFDVKFFSEDEFKNAYSEMPFIKNILSYGIQI